MRVMLMVQTATDKRPKVAWYGKHAHNTAGVFQRDERRNAEAARDGRSGDYVPLWWLVEAESANEARVAIEYARLIPGSAVFESMKDGHKARILASGGRS